MRISLSNLSDTIFNLNSAMAYSDAKTYTTEDFLHGLKLQEINTQKNGFLPFENAALNVVKKSENTNVFTTSANLNNSQASFYVTSFDDDTLILVHTTSNEETPKLRLINIIDEVIKNTYSEDEAQEPSYHLSKKLVPGFEYADGEPYSYVLNYENEIVQFNNGGIARDQSGNMLSLPYIKAQLDPLPYGSSNVGTDGRLNNKIKPEVITKVQEVQYESIDNAINEGEVDQLTFLDQLTHSQRQSLDALANTLNITDNERLENLARRVFNI